MHSFIHGLLRRIGWLIGFFGLTAILIWLLPREEVLMGAVSVFDDPAAFLAEREGGFDDIRQGDGARIVWAGEAGAATPLSVLYLHGSSAGPEEIRPVADDVAEALGANLVFARLSGHGRDGDAMAEPRAGDWLADTALFLDIARAVGERHRHLDGRHAGGIGCDRSGDGARRGRDGFRGA